MSGKSDIILVGGGGHCRSCIDVLECHGQYRIAGIVDVRDRVGQTVLGYEIVGCDEDLPRFVRGGTAFLVTLGQISSPGYRRALYNVLLSLSADMPTIVSPFAYVSRHAEIGPATIVLHHAIVNAGAKVGRNCIINTKAIVEHDAIVDDNCHISTGAVINGASIIGADSFVGSLAAVKESTTVARGSIVGAGAVVVSDIVEPGFYAGVPARKIRPE